MKLILTALATLTFATPAQALTWKEFWEPFVVDHHHHHGHYYHGDGCEPIKYDYHRWVSGYWNGRRWVSGYYHVETRTKYVGCHHDHHDPVENWYRDNPQRYYRP
jgi:hypothetical protein|tara:strand:- start:3065 stop:3379 length:315 start_codon:yes stop_codon:yes gene_type:complete